MITRGFIRRIHQGAYIRRWNDHLRPDQGFYELDKQAHKMAIAFFLAKIEEHVYGKAINYQYLIEGGLFQYFHRIELTDIKPSLFDTLMRERGNELNTYVIGKWKDDLESLGDGLFFGRFRGHLDEDVRGEGVSIEHQILGAAHYLATKWEFDLIYTMNGSLYGIDETKKQVEEKLDRYKNLDCVKHIVIHTAYQRLFNLIGQLRFQRRWTQTVRTPETSVMGHTLIVAILAYVVSLERNLSADGHAVYHFWQGLFHDIPEVLTRDIISPVKQSVQSLEDIIKGIEDKELERRIKPLLPDEPIQSEFFWYMRQEFESKQHPDSRGHIDGKMVKHCDLYAAYVEASLSLYHGVYSLPLEEACRNIEKRLATEQYDRFRWRELLDYFSNS